MKISDILNRDAILPDLCSETKADVIQELAGAIAPLAHTDPASIGQVLLERESLGSTGIGGGIAIPHGKLPSVKEVCVGFGRSSKGVEYDALDNLPVHIFFLLLTPEDSTGGHLKVLAQISKLLKMDMFKDRLKTAQSAREIFDIIAEQDEEF
jgi:PTS system nitrogen regulatory IIA component